MPKPAAGEPMPIPAAIEPMPVSTASELMPIPAASELIPISSDSPKTLELPSELPSSGSKSKFFYRLMSYILYLKFYLPGV